MFKQSIFLRIYGGLVILVLLVALFGYLFVQIINYKRAQDYRQSLTDGISFVISEGVARQSTHKEKMDWISDASSLLEVPIYYLDTRKVDLTRSELRRIDDQKAVIRYDAQNQMTYIVMGIKNDPEHLLYMSLNVEEIKERQMRVIPTFIWDYLAYYPGAEKQELAQIQKHFQYKLEIKNIVDLNLDTELMSRILLGHSIVSYKDSGSESGTNITILSPKPNFPRQVLVIGPIPLFNWMPFELATGVTLLSLFVLSLGVYGLLVPMQRKLREVNYALNRMKSGDLSLRLPVNGSDEMASLASNYNNMANHIQRLIEAQRELMRAVSHELRTPVARIRFGMEMLADEDNYSERLQQVEQIDKDIEALNNLIDEIMTYAKLEQGTPSFEFERIVLAEVLEQVMSETEALKTQKEVILNSPLASLEVDAEYRYLHRVVQNLVGNAVRYCDDKVLVSGGINNQGLAYICVEDDGCGIPEADRKRVFEAFARLDGSRTRASGGYGLGLSIVSRIAYWFGGKVEVDESPTLGGARFTMTWPARRFKKKLKDMKTK